MDSEGKARDGSQQPNAMGDPEAWVDEHGDALFRYALSRLRDRSVAEDLVQETFLAALEARARFRGASAPRTWLVSVLRHKLIDHLRRAGRMTLLDDVDAVGNDREGAFDARGRWAQRPGRWEAVLPTDEMERREFHQAVRHCAEAIGGRSGDAYSLRVLCDLPPQEVCKVLDVKPTNLWVLLHRARSRMRDCLERAWFRSEQKGQGGC